MHVSVITRNRTAENHCGKQAEQTAWQRIFEKQGHRHLRFQHRIPEIVDRIPNRFRCRRIFRKMQHSEDRQRNQDNADRRNDHPPIADHSGDHRFVRSPGRGIVPGIALPAPGVVNRTEQADQEIPDVKILI